MTDAVASIRHSPAAGTIRVAAPRLGDILSGALHSAYDDPGATLEEFSALLAKLDRIDCKTH